jgi:5'(3')-deoxyribonucleotidase
LASGRNVRHAGLGNAESRTATVEIGEQAVAPGREFVLGVDLDGVCGDFYETLRPLAAEWLGREVDDLTREVSYGLPEWGLTSEEYQRLHRWAVTQRDLFRVLTPIPRAASTLRRLSALGHIRIRIITHRLFIPHFHQEAIQQTVEWLDFHGFPYKDLCFMADKGAVAANVYIDDTPSNIAQLRAMGATAIVFTNSTNRDLDGPRADTWEQVEATVLDTLKQGSSEPH